MHSFILVSFLASLSFAFDFPILMASITWPSAVPGQNIITNMPFQVSATFQFPSWTTTKSMHPLTIDNPGPRPDSYLVQLSLAHLNGTIIRMIFQQEIAAANGEWSPNVQFFLPSYIIENGSQQFAFHITLSNHDQIMDMITSWTTKSTSPPFYLVKPSTLGDGYISDQVFLGGGDGQNGKTVSLYYGMWSSSNGPHKKLIQSVFTGTGESISFGIVKDSA